ncbi:MAG: hypothetical protein ABI204_04660 [Ginsengibacter sp.]
MPYSILKVKIDIIEPELQKEIEYKNEAAKENCGNHSKSIN